MTLLNSNYEDYFLNNTDYKFDKFKIDINKISDSGALFDIDKLNLSDELYRLQWKFIGAAIDLMAGPYAIMDTGSSWNAMEVLLEHALPKLSGRERMAIADLIGGRIAVAGPYPSRKEYIRQFRKK